MRRRVRRAGMLGGVFDVVEGRGMRAMERAKGRLGRTTKMSASVSLG